MEAYWKIAHDLVDDKRPGDFNQAMMEIGATVCSPKNPNCSQCPLKKQCQAYKELKSGNDIDDIENCSSKTGGRCRNRQLHKAYSICIHVSGCNLCIPKDDKYVRDAGVTNYPRKGKKAPQRIQKTVVCIFKSEDKYLLTQRPETGLLANLLEFPSLMVLQEDENEPELKTISSLIRSKTTLSLTNSQLCYLGHVYHQFSHIKQTYLVWKIDACTRDFKIDIATPKSTWLTEEEINKSAISTAMKKVFKLKVIYLTIKRIREMGGQ